MVVRMLLGWPPGAPFNLPGLIPPSECLKLAQYLALGSNSREQRSVMRFLGESDGTTNDSAPFAGSPPFVEHEGGDLSNSSWLNVGLHLEASIGSWQLTRSGSRSRTNLLNTRSQEGSAIRRAELIWREMFTQVDCVVSALPGYLTFGSLPAVLLLLYLRREFSPSPRSTIKSNSGVNVISQGQN